MPRIKSSIADDFEKLLAEAGVLKEAYNTLEQYKDDPEARVGSDSVSDIEALYNVKPDGQDYEHCIMEQAHPNSVIIAPSYDKINGLVENNIERANIMHNIALKPNTGNHTNPKYAHQELTLELVRIANEMDNKNHTELFTLADDCLATIHKEALSWDEFKQWVSEKVRDTGAIGEGALPAAGIGTLIGALATSWSGPGVLLGATIGASVGGLIAAFTKTAPQVKNVEENAHEVSKQLKDLNSLADQADFFALIEKGLQALIASAKQYQDKLGALKMAAIKQDASHAEGIDDVAKVFQHDIATIKQLHEEFDRRAKSGAFAKANPSKVLKPVYWFMDDNIDDVSDAFDSLEDAIVKLQNSTKENTTEAVANASSKAPDAPAASAPAKSPAPGKSMPDENSWLKYITDF